MPFTPAGPTLVNSKGRLYLTADERRRFFETVRISPNTRSVPRDLALGYKQLQRVEQAWRQLKSTRYGCARSITAPPIASTPTSP